jgi:hypothetical protein
MISDPDRFLEELPRLAPTHFSCMYRRDHGANGRAGWRDGAGRGLLDLGALAKA